MNLPLGQYALFRSAPLGIRGLRDCRDVDVIVSTQLWQKCLADGWQIRQVKSGNQCLSKGEIELWLDWYPGEWDVEDLIENSEMIDGLPFVKLDQVLKWKKIMGRDKDMVDVKIIEKFLSDNSK